MDLFRSSSLGQFQSLLSGYQQSSPIAAKHASATAARSGRNLNALQRQRESAEAARIHWNTTRSSLACSNARTSSCCLWGYIYTLSTHHTPSQASAPAKHQTLFQKTLSRNTYITGSLTRQLPERHNMTKLSFQRNQKSPLHPTIKLLNYYFIL